MATRQRLVAELRERLAQTGFPRLTVVLILTLAGAAAFISSAIALAAGVEFMAIRYGLAVIVGYIAFVLLLRGWIALMRRTPSLDLGPDPLDILDITCSVYPASGPAVGHDVSLDLDDGVWILAALVAACGGVVCIGYVIYTAPLLLAEVALDAALVSAVYRRLRKEDMGHWAGAVVRRTWIPTVALVVFMSVVGFALQRVAPDAHSIGGVIRALMTSG